MEEINNTLYINNINEKVKPDVLKKQLYMLFAQYGKIAQIISRKGLKMKGQAWVVFHDSSSAAAAFKSKQGFNFFGKPLKIQYAKEKSLLIARKEGLSIPIRSNKRSRDENIEDEPDIGAPSKEARL